MFEETYINIYQNNKKHPGFQTIGDLIYYQMSSLEKPIKLKQLGFKQSLIKFITKNNFVSLNYWFNIVAYSLDYYVDEHFNKTKPSIPSILYINKFVQKEIKERFIYSFYINDLKVKMVVGSEV